MVGGGFDGFLEVKMHHRYPAPSAASGKLRDNPLEMVLDELLWRDLGAKSFLLCLNQDS